MKRLIFIPDIHGRYDLLMTLLGQLFEYHKVDLSPGQDKIIFGGDYVDRGPNSAGVLAKVRELTEKYPGQVIALAGNHEWLMINACTRGLSPGPGYEDFQLWMWNGGQDTLDSYVDQRVPDEVIRWVASLPTSHEEPDFFFSHAPLPIERLRRSEYKGSPEWAKDELIWTYFPEEGRAAHRFPGGKVGVCGHVHALRRQLANNERLEPRFYDHYIFADAGCGCHPKAPLVAVEVKSREVFYAHPSEAMGTCS